MKNDRNKCGSEKYTQLIPVELKLSQCYNKMLFVKNP